MLFSYLLAAALWATAAQAQVATYSLSGNLRLQIGNWLLIPLTTAGPPTGAVGAIPGATVMQTTGPDPRRMTIHPAQLTAPAGDFLLHPPCVPWIWEMQTAIAVQFPAQTVTFQASGRTGPPTVTWCPGQLPPFSSYNPSCTDPLASGLPTKGLLRYVRTLAQFGGPAQAALQGSATVALAVSGSPPCDFSSGPCVALFTQGPAFATDPRGGAFGFVTTTTRPPPSPGLFNARVTTLGRITYVTPTGLAPGIANSVTSFGAPWTTGQIMVSAQLTISGSTQRFTFTGSDARVSGVGNISLVSAGLSMRELTGPDASRGWLNLTVPEPAALGGAAAAFLVLAACHGLVRRRGQ